MKAIIEAGIEAKAKKFGLTFWVNSPDFFICLVAITESLTVCPRQAAPDATDGAKEVTKIVEIAEL